MKSITRQVSAVSRIEFDVENAATIAIGIIGGSVNATGVAFTFEASLDSSDKNTGSWVTASGRNVNGGAAVFSTGATTINTGTIHSVTIFDATVFKKIRVNVTGITAGNIVIIGNISDKYPAYGPTTVSSGGSSIGKNEDDPHSNGHTGAFILGVRNDNALATYAGANGDYVPMALDNMGVQFNRRKPALTIANPITTVPGTTNFQISASNGNRRIGIFHNKSNVEVFVRFGATAATTTAYHIAIAANEKFVLPEGLSTAIQVISASAGTGNFIFTEFID